MHRCDLTRRDVGARRLARRREVDGADVDAAFLQPVANEAQFVALGVEGADDKRGPADPLDEGQRQKRPRLRPRFV